MNVAGELPSKDTLTLDWVTGGGVSGTAKRRHRDLAWLRLCSYLQLPSRTTASTNSHVITEVISVRRQRRRTASHVTPQSDQHDNDSKDPLPCNASDYCSVCSRFLALRNPRHRRWQSLLLWVNPRHHRQRKSLSSLSPLQEQSKTPSSNVARRFSFGKTFSGTALQVPKKMRLNWQPSPPDLRKRDRMALTFWLGTWLARVTLSRMHCWGLRGRYDH